MKDPGYKSGPALIANCPTLRSNGNYPYGAFGWYSAMVIYNTPADKPAFVYEEPYSQGYQVNNQLRLGEKLTFNWSNKGLHVGMLDAGSNAPGCLTAASGEKNLAYMATYGDLSNQRVGNGVLRYHPPIASLKDIAFAYDNLAVENGKLHPADATKPATLTLDMPCSYVYLAGTLKIFSSVPNLDSNRNEVGSLNIQISDNNGLDWKELADLKGPAFAPLGLILDPDPDKASPYNLEYDLQKHIFRRYGYRLKFTLTGKADLSTIYLIHDFQCSQRALPALGQGENTLTFSAGRGGANESTLTISPAPSKHKEKQLTAACYHAVLNNMTENDNGQFVPSGSDASITYTITTPTPLTRLRLGSQYRGRANTHWLYQVSFDQGKTFMTMHQTADHNRSDFAWITYDKIPANTTSAQVRFAAVGEGDGNLILFHHRIDADYALPAGFAPVLATYTWGEDGQDKSDAHVALTPADVWKIVCPAKPTMRSLTIERAPR